MSIGRYQMCVPKEHLEEDEKDGLDWFTLSPQIFEHKEYPRCVNCRQKFVPLKKGARACFKCIIQRK